MIPIAIATAWLLSVAVLASPVLRLALQGALTLAKLLAPSDRPLTAPRDRPSLRTADVVRMPTRPSPSAPDRAAA